MIFRYPGGKSKVCPFLLDYFSPYFGRGAFHDVFVGGGSVLLAVAEILPKIKLFANDLDPYISAFWSVVAEGNDDLEDLLSLLEAIPTIKLFNQLRATPPTTRLEKAYYAVFFNRTTFSGILKSGPIGGYNQSSKWKVGCRYNVNRLKYEILDAAELLNGRLSVSCKPANTYIKNIPDADCMYLDPPYFKKGKELYSIYMKNNEHKELAELLQTRRNWVLSYDICPEIDALYGWAKKEKLGFRYSISGEKKSWADKKEYIIQRS